jgi:hypothetical protein
VGVRPAWLVGRACGEVRDLQLLGCEGPGPGKPISPDERLRLITR